MSYPAPARFWSRGRNPVRCRWKTSASTFIPARRSGLSANPVPARPPPAAPCLADQDDSGRQLSRQGHHTVPMARALRKLRRNMQLVFQDPYSSLNPPHEGDRHRRRAAVRARPRQATRTPRQVASPMDWSACPPTRMTVSRTLFPAASASASASPGRLRCSPSSSSPTSLSALDVSVRAQVVNLFRTCRRSLGLTYLFIAHDLSVVRHISHRVAILYAGRMVEIAGATSSTTTAPSLHRGAALGRAGARPASRARAHAQRPSEAPDVVDPTPGCRYQARCPLVRDRCRNETPTLTPRDDGHLSPASSAEWYESSVTRFLARLRK